MGVGTPPQCPELVHKAAVYSAPGLLLLPTQHLGHRADARGPGDEHVLVPRARAGGPEGRGVSGVRAGVAHRRVDHREDSLGNDPTPDTRGDVPSFLEAVARVGPGRCAAPMDAGQQRRREITRRTCRNLCPLPGREEVTDDAERNEMTPKAAEGRWRPGSALGDLTARK